VRTDAPVLCNPKGYGHKRLRIAYASSDFCLHPVSILMAELFELHNHTDFEIFGYCWSPEDGSALRQRVINAMDQFHRIHGLGDEDAAQLILSHEIDVLIDLQGQTSGARPNMLALRPAPIQVTYLGLPATTGLPSIDYVIADRFLIPEDTAAMYSEKPLYMPDIYQVSDRKRCIGPTPTRAQCGLPDNGFVFCSLNNNYKYTPEMFDVWMRILQRTPDSVLWLLSDNPWAQENLRKEASARGVDSKRLLFADRVSPENYLARYACADLFLDTFPFNAGTTANDALWVGLPLLTLCGRAFASRMAGALLTAAGMPELITYNLADYEEKAVALGSDAAACRRLREQLKSVRESGALFNTGRFARNLEQRLHELVAAL
jgi:predicted O-linked N-acetylglucosamine transferase (SPINDLY family)